MSGVEESVKYRILGETAAGAPTVMTDWMDPDVYGPPEERLPLYSQWTNKRVEWRYLQTGSDRDDVPSIGGGES